MSVTDEIKARLDITEFIGNYVQLKKAGRSYKSLCPFHSEKTPSFVVFPESQTWRCFGACGEGGDIFSFVMKHEGWDFAEALRFLAEKTGVELSPPSPEQVEEREIQDRLLELLDEVARFYYRQLLSAPEANYARAYVEQRGLSPETLATFGLGYAPHSWDATTHHLSAKGYEQQDLVDAGLLVVKDEGGTYDRFRNRLMIPICDLRGRAVGFGARALAQDDVPKYLNSPQSMLFDKSSLLFGLSQARRSIREKETAIIVEGYMDVMQAHQAGFTNVVAEMGTALTEPQLRLLARYASRLILALDPDVAGQTATDRGREVIERVSRDAAEQVGRDGVWDFDSAEREYRAKLTTEFDPRGMVRYESRLGFDIRILALPEGKDPDDLIRESPTTWQRLVDEALPVVEYAIQTTIQGLDLNHPKVKSAVASKITPLINDIASPVERSHYRQRLSRLLRVDERALFPERSLSDRQPRPVGPPPQESLRSASDTHAARPSAFTPTLAREAFCLAALLQYERLLYHANRVLAECLEPAQIIHKARIEILPDLDCLARQVTPNDFAHPEHREILLAWHVALEQDELPPLRSLKQILTPLARQRIETWLLRPLYALLRDVTPLDKELTYDHVYVATVQGLLDLRQKRIEEALQDLVFLIQDESENGNISPAWENRDVISTLIAARERVEQAQQRYTLAGRNRRELGDAHLPTQAHRRM